MNKNVNNLEALLQKYFDTAFDSPNGIKELRGLILKLAMMGKLVPQDANDKPASELLKEIQSEKKKLLAEGKIKKQKPLPEITPEEIPYELPDGWVWTRLDNVTSKITDGDHQTPPRINKGYRLLSAKNVRDGFLRFTTCEFISKDHYLKSRERCLPEKGDLLIVSVGGTIGRTSLVPPDSEFALVRSVALIKPLIFDSDFLKHSMDAELLQNFIHTRKRGGAQPCLYLSEIRKFLFPLPPLNEQKRIVEKINELMARCDEMERLKKEQQDKRLKTSIAALHQLAESKDKNSFNSAFNFITNNFSSLYSVKENVENLKKTILQLAMMGKLVPQDANDQSASELLKEIQSEKKKMVTEGKIRKQKPLPKIKTEEIPYELPDGWVWCRLGELGEVQTGTTPPTKDPTNFGDFIPFIGPGDIQNNKIDLNNKGLSETGIKKGRIIDSNSILMVCIGGSIGKHVINKVNVTCNQQINTITPFIRNTEFLFYILASKYFQSTARGSAGGSATPIINKNKWSAIVIPIPPLNEQKRIVEKINELMNLCDNMLDRIEKSERTQDKLLHSILAKE